MKFQQMFNGIFVKMNRQQAYSVTDLILQGMQPASFMLIKCCLLAAAFLWRRIGKLFINHLGGRIIRMEKYSPFNQYTANNIESKLIINVGAIYKAATAVTVSIMGLQTGNIPLVGNTNGYLLNLKDGQIIKTYNTLDGTVELDVQGHADFNPITVSLSVTASSANKELPFDGTWNFKVSEGSTLTIKKWCMDWFLARIKS